ncbi:MAG: hypothetical protein LBQ28_06785 [Prevotellaceae bacterium]|jgi:hypothetical protein|nr:hypothetical protein [Prevotellaceae bacterium]
MRIKNYFKVVLKAVMSVGDEKERRFGGENILLVDFMLEFVDFVLKRVNMNHTFA